MRRVVVTGIGLLTPLGWGVEKSWKGIVEGRREGPFTSVENLKKRTGASKTSIEVLREHGCLDGMDESDQLALFM